MQRPTIFCHMTMSLNGKIVGKYHQAKNAGDAGELFYHAAFEPGGAFDPNEGWLSGRKTTDDNFTFYRKPDLDKTAARVPDGDFIVPNTNPKYYFSIDPHGRLGWESNQLHYNDTTATVVEVLTNQASNAYKAFLRQKQISYVIAGDTVLDAPLAISKLTKAFNLHRIMLGGGGVLNWSFIKQGLCDEVSIVLIPGVDGDSQTPALFQPLPTDDPDKLVNFTLKSATPVGDTVWLRYSISNS